MENAIFVFIELHEFKVLTKQIYVGPFLKKKWVFLLA